MDTNIAQPATRTVSVRAAGWLCVAGAVIGVIGGLVTAFASPAVTTDRYSYPYTPTGYVLAELAFIANHLLLLIGVLGIARSGATGAGRLARTGLWTTAIGLLALTLCEVGSTALADSAYPTPRTDALDAGYGISTMLIGAGLVMTGVAVVKTRRWTGWSRYVVLACGIAVFILVIPGVFSTFLAGRLVLVAWMLMFAALGLALVRSGERA